MDVPHRLDYSVETDLGDTMAVDTAQIIEEAEKLGKLIAQHPAVEKYKQAQRAVAEDIDASRLMAEFNRQLETLVRQEQAGAAVTDAQRMALESLQGKIVSHIKIKSLNMAEVDFVDLLRKVSQTYQRPLADAAAAGGPAAGGPRLTMPRA
jgi:cell fate (sporulation/competence/biofilm development) regulator YlbF (YheA/YmcA/DUF963 family)